jgi:tryptophan-rich sensory protein
MGMLYIMMGIAAGLVWAQIDFEKGAGKKSVSLFMIQLALNALCVVSLFFWFAQSYVSRNRNYSIVVDDFETYSQF